MIKHKISIFILAQLFISPLYAHPKHHESQEQQQVNQAYYTGLLKNSHNDELRNQVVTLLLDKAYAKGDGNILEQAEILMETSYDPSGIDNILISTKIAQANHNFKKAEHNLLKILQREPENYDATLQLANIYRLQGKFSQSLQECNKLSHPALRAYRLGCELQVQAMSQNYTTIKPKAQEVLTLTPNLKRADQQWLANIILEVAGRFNDPALAEQGVNLLKTDNLPNAIAKSNWYISQHDYQSALNILSPYRYHNGAMYRIILSKQKMNDDSALIDLNELTQRIQQLLSEKDHIHLREQAQYLWLTQQFTAGLKVAQDNWEMQRENDDFEVYAALAIDSKNTVAAQKLLNWSMETGYQNPTYIPKLQQTLHTL